MVSWPRHFVAPAAMRSRIRVSVCTGLLLGCLALLQTAPGAEPLCAHPSGERGCDLEQAPAFAPAFELIFAPAAGRFDPAPPPLKHDGPPLGSGGPQPPTALDPWELGLTAQLPPAALLAQAAPGPAYEVHDRPEVRRQLAGLPDGRPGGRGPATRPLGPLHRDDPGRASRPWAPRGPVRHGDHRELPQSRRGLAGRRQGALAVHGRHRAPLRAARGPVGGRAARPGEVHPGCGQVPARSLRDVRLVAARPRRVQRRARGG